MHDLPDVIVLLALVLALPAAVLVGVGLCIEASERASIRRRARSYGRADARRRSGTH